MSAPVHTLPARGARWPELERRLLALRAADPRPERGWPDTLWPMAPDRAFLAAREAQAMFAHTNGFIAPQSVKTLEAELREMVASVLRVPGQGLVTLTVGGTESNFLAMRAARNRFRANGGAGTPRVLIPQSAHPSFDKAGSDLDVEVVRIPLDRDYRAHAMLIAEAIDERTCLIAGSAPGYPFGVIDPIERLGEIAAEHELWLHVDACVGGFLLPFFRRLGALSEEFDFSIPGVTSISADLHKFGFCLNGISTYSVRDEELARFQAFELHGDEWLYQPYRRVGFTGTRAGGTVAAAWATLTALGEDGYLEIAEGILSAAQRLGDGIEAINGISLMAPHEGGVVVIRGDDSAVSCAALAGELQRREWPVRSTVEPARVWFLLSPVPDAYVDAFLHDLADAVALCRAGEVAEPELVESYGTP